nr:uncharacterized protein LOC122273677 [Parasteatoda tepidariorum]
MASSNMKSSNDYTDQEKYSSYHDMEELYHNKEYSKHSSPRCNLEHSSGFGLNPETKQGCSSPSTTPSSTDFLTMLNSCSPDKFQHISKDWMLLTPQQCQNYRLFVPFNDDAPPFSEHPYGHRLYSICDLIKHLLEHGVEINSNNKLFYEKTLDLPIPAPFAFITTISHRLYRLINPENEQEKSVNYMLTEQINTLLEMLSKSIINESLSIEISNYAFYFSCIIKNGFPFTINSNSAFIHDPMFFNPYDYDSSPYINKLFSNTFSDPTDIGIKRLFIATRKELYNLCNPTNIIYTEEPVPFIKVGKRYLSPTHDERSNDNNKKQALDLKNQFDCLESEAIHPTSPVTIISHQKIDSNPPIPPSDNSPNITTNQNNKPPPIMVQTDIKFDSLLANINMAHDFKVTGKPDRGYLKLFTNTPNEHRTITKYLLNNNINHYIINTKTSKQIKIVIRGLPIDYDLKEINSHLNKLNFFPKDIHQMRYPKGDRRLLPLFLIKLDNSPINKSIIDIKELGFFEVIMEKFKANNLISQCHRCQLWRHTSRQCNMTPKCVKCGDPHLTADCPTKGKISTPKCSNCGGNHPANYRGCPHFPRPKNYPPPPSKSQFNKYDHTPSINNPPNIQNNAQPNINDNHCDTINTLTTIKDLASDESFIKLITQLKNILPTLSLLNNPLDKFLAIIQALAP